MSSKNRISVSIRIAALVALTTACTGGGSYQNDGSTILASKKAALNTPVLSCGSSTQTTININVKAGASGAPAGFSLQWMTSSDFVTNGGFFLSEDGRLCKASFSGVPKSTINRFSLAPNASTTVEAGNLFDEELGVSFNCNDDLTCGTTYVFRSFAHNDPVSGAGKSALTETLSCSTLACEADISCTLTQGYWKTHGYIPTGNNVNEWAQDVNDNGMLLGNVLYSAAQLQAIFDTPAAGNGLIVLAHQLIAAKLNILNGADPSAISASIALADILIANNVIPPVGANSLPNSATSSLSGSLASYNEGLIGPGHCE
jgi:hypothetical protein